jgi:hypothetical protein
MDEFDFIDALSEKRTDGEALFNKMKQANAAANFIRKNAVPIAGALAAGATLTGLSYQAMKPGKDGAPSTEQKLSREAVKATGSMMDKAKKEGREPGFAPDLAHSISKGAKEVADTFARHPKRSSLLALPGGLALGWNLAKRIQHL